MFLFSPMFHTLSPIGYVFRASFATAIACGLGAVPFIWLKNIHPKGIGYANAIAASMMIAASFQLIYEGLQLPGDHRSNTMRVMGGMVIGLVFILITHHRAEQHEDVKRNGVHSLKKTDNASISHSKTSRKKAFLIIVIMTMHSGAEGMAMGVAQGASTVLGTLVFIVMALQNIPE
jgi:zinc transporter, ZIP family